MESAAMLLAAGRGQRLRPITDTLPKPLIEVGGRSLLEWHLAALEQSGTEQVLINTGWLGEQIPRYLAQRNHKTHLIYSREDVDFGHALETAGGIARALPLLSPVFWLAAGDAFAPDFVFDPQIRASFAASTDLAHLWLVSNPEHNPRGDFGLSPEGRATLIDSSSNSSSSSSYTYSTIALLKAELFTPPWCAIPAGNPEGEIAPLAPLLRRAIQANRISASLYTGRWIDVGTPERLEQARQLIKL